MHSEMWESQSWFRDPVHEKRLWPLDSKTIGHPGKAESHGSGENRSRHRMLGTASLDGVLQKRGPLACGRLSLAWWREAWW